MRDIVMFYSVSLYMCVYNTLQLMGVRCITGLHTVSTFRYSNHRSLADM